MRPIVRAVALVAVPAALAGCGMFRAADAPSSQAQVTLRVADAAMESGAPDLALRVAEVVLEKQPGNVDAMVAKGNALYAMGAAEQARAVYRTAVKVDPDNIGGQIGLGRTLVRSDPHEAETHFLAALARQSDNVVALNNLGIAQDLQGRHDEAQKAYRQALAISPEAADVKTNLGLSLALAGQGSQAVQVLQPVATAPEASAMKRADLAVAIAQEQDKGPSGPVKEQTVAAATAHFDAPLAISTAPVRSVDSQPLAQQPEAPVARQQVAIAVPVAVPAAPQQPVEHAVKPVAIVRPMAPPPAALPPAAPTPTAAAATPAQESKAPTDGIYVQMASLDSEQAAHNEWQRLRSHWPDLFTTRSPVVLQAEVHERTYWRLRTGGFSSVGDASDFCGKLRAAGSGCWTVGLSR